MTTKVIIVGAGPAGVLLAHYLLRRGNYQVKLYESRSDPRFVSFANDRTFPISLTQRGLKAIVHIEGLEEKILSQGTITNGTLRHRKKGKARLLPRKKPLLVIDRTRLVIILLENLLEKSENQPVSIHFNSQCTNINLKEKILELKTANGKLFTDNYDLLIGADGANSIIRSSFVNTEIDPFDCEQNYVSNAYKSIFISRINEQVGLELDSDKLHSWRNDQEIQIVLAPQGEKGLNGVMIFNPQNNCLEKFSSKEEVLKFFADHFPEISQLMSEEEAEALLKRPISQVLTVRCNRYHQGNSVLILGDAAHAVSPSIGQGCNSALEDVEIFNNLLDEMGENWLQAIPEFTKRRLLDAHALQELSNYIFPTNKRLLIEFFVRLAWARFLHKIFPQSCQPFCLDLIFETTLPYSEILKSSQGWIAKVKNNVSH